MSLKAEESTQAIFDQEGEGISSSQKLFKGVRRRKWGRWVSEIRVPKSRARIWLGSFDSAEKAARAYDAAVYCLRGEAARFNFPVEEIPRLPEDQRLALTMDEVKAIATRHAYWVPPPPSGVLPLQNEVKEEEEEMELKLMAAAAAVAQEDGACHNLDSSAAPSYCSHLDYSLESLLFADTSVIEEVISLWELL